MTRIACAWLAVCAGLAWAGGDAPATAVATPQQQGAALLLPFKRDLQAALQAGLAAGPEQAIDACRVTAPQLAAAASVGGVRMGRTSERLRNPANAPEPWMQALLAQYAAQADDRSPRWVALPDGRIGYAEPITVQPLCLACHGEQLAPAVAERLRVAYPDDRATGYRAGDLRGIFWVAFTPAS